MNIRFSLVAICVFLFSQTILAADGSRPVYSKVRIIGSTSELSAMRSAGLFPDHFTGSIERGMDVVVDEVEMASLDLLGVRYEVLVPDLSAQIRQRPPMTESEKRTASRILHSDNIEGFEYGTMGGFYTFDQVVTELDSMLLLYPQIITPKTSIGMSHEGRDIWMVKISNNPNDDESATEPAVHYDALHHAREPASMMSAIYYMYWLLENYGTDLQATYLVDHREMFFVLVVNPDGYVYNEQTDPNGGGFWRKNRRVSGGGCFGVDLNRNYSFGFGDPNGSSGDPCSETYRGPDPFSEPETEAIRDLVAVTDPVIGFSSHTYGEKFLNPYGYIEEAPEYEIYSEFSSDFLAQSDYLYGITAEMLGYFSSGTTRDYLHSEGTYAWTPELGENGFWPPQSDIIPIASENLTRFRYIAWVAGAFADLKNVRFDEGGFAAPGDTLSFTVGVKNRGLTQTAADVQTVVTPLYADIQPFAAAAVYEDIPAREVRYGGPFQFVLTDTAEFLEEIPLVISISQEGVETDRDTVYVTAGYQLELFSDDAESGLSLWTRSGSGIPWDTTFVDSYDGSFSFADSRYGNSQNNTNNVFALASPVSLTDATNPRLLFSAKWSIEGGFDYARAQVSMNGGIWTSLSGRYTTIVGGQPSYTGARHWVNEEIDLSDYAGNEIYVRFHYQTDGGVPGDGFYFDNFRIVEYTDDPGATSVGTYPEAIHGPSLMQNHPNPFNPETTIRYGIAERAFVTIKVYSMLGELVATLVDETQEPGYRSVTWDGRSDGGYDAASGVYFYRLTTDSFVRTMKLVLLR